MNMCLIGWWFYSYVCPRNSCDRCRSPVGWLNPVGWLSPVGWLGCLSVCWTPPYGKFSYHYGFLKPMVLFVSVRKTHQPVWTNPEEVQLKIETWGSRATCEVDALTIWPYPPGVELYICLSGIPSLMHKCNQGLVGGCTSVHIYQRSLNLLNARSDIRSR